MCGLERSRHTLQRHKPLTIGTVVQTQNDTILDFELLNVLVCVSDLCGQCTPFPIYQLGNFIDTSLSLVLSLNSKCTLSGGVWSTGGFSSCLYVVSLSCCALLTNLGISADVAVE